MGEARQLYEGKISEVFQAEIVAVCDDYGDVHTSLPGSRVKFPAIGNVVYINGTRWVIEDRDSDGTVYLVFRKTA